MFFFPFLNHVFNNNHTEAIIIGYNDNYCAEYFAYKVSGPIQGFSGIVILFEILLPHLILLYFPDNYGGEIHDGDTATE